MRRGKTIKCVFNWEFHYQLATFDDKYLRDAVKKKIKFTEHFAIKSVKSKNNELYSN